MKIADPDSVLDRFPHQLSGGMLQRVVIAMALAGDPQLLVLDEPTTGLDATVEAEVLDLVRDLRQETNAAVLLIAHNLGVIRSMCDRVGVMYAGKIVEQGDAQEVFEQPKHPYTMGLLNAIPRKGLRKTDRALFTIPGNLPQIGAELPTCVYVDRCPLADELCRTEVPPVVEVDGHPLDAVPPPRQGRRHRRTGSRVTEHSTSAPTTSSSSTASPRRSASVATTCRRWSASISGFAEGETLGLVGESGSGKITLAKTLLGIHAPDEGGRDHARGRPMKARGDRPVATSRSGRCQMVFQNPDSALNRTWTVRRILKRTVTKLTGSEGRRSR